MYADVHKHHVPYADLFRWSARACAVSLFVAWLGLVVHETVRSGPPTTALILYQAAAFAVVFAGYALGWRSDSAGGVLTIIGTSAFLAATLFTVGVLPPLEAVWFAAPGILYFLAWLFGDRHPATGYRLPRIGLGVNGCLATASL